MWRWPGGIGSWRRSPERLPCELVRVVAHFASPPDRRWLNDAWGLDQARGPFYSALSLEVKVSRQPIMSLVLKGIALAMGAATVVMGILRTGSPATLITLLGIGLFCLALWALQRRD